MYYNPVTEQKLTRQQLKALLNASFPMDAEQVDDWHLLHTGDAQELLNGQSVMPGPVAQLNGHYVQTYVATGAPQPQQQDVADRLTDIEEQLAKFPVDDMDPRDVMERLSDIEDAVLELAGIIAGE